MGCHDRQCDTEERNKDHRYDRRNDLAEELLKVGQNEAGKQIDEVFVKFLPYMLERAPKDAALLDRMIKECQSEYKGWNTEEFLFFDEVRRNITINPTERLIGTCPNCGAEVRSTVRFPNGIKYLFAIQGKHRKFGSK